MRVAIGSDHAGVALKETVKVSLLNDNHEVLDVGTDGDEPLDYPDYAQAVGQALRESKAERGIILCSSGVGASMAANRIPGIRAGLCHDTYSAHQGVEHDDMNVLVLGGRVVGVELARDLIRAFLNARFNGEERHLRRIAKLAARDNPVRALLTFGQSVWLEGMRRGLITSGELNRLIEEDALRGVVSNPAVVEKAIAGSKDYNDMLDAPDTHPLSPGAVCERLAVRDMQEAADALRPVYESSARRDGYVCLEIAPRFAHDRPGTIDEARRLRQHVGRDNLMVSVPATAEGIDAIRTLIGEGLNVEVTSLFGPDGYAQAADAYITGLEQLVASGGDVARVASVASFGISRLDTALDVLLEAQMQAASDARDRIALRALMGKGAIANAKLAYQKYRERFSGARWHALSALGAHSQRLLWTGTAVKNPEHCDVLYVEELIGPETIVGMCPSTIDAFRDHGRPRASLVEDVDAAFDAMTLLEKAGVSMKELAATLLADSVRCGVEAYDALLKAVDRHTRLPRSGQFSRMTCSLPKPLAGAITRTLGEWRTQRKVRRLWARDASLWTGKDEGRWLGWLGLTNDHAAHIDRLAHIAEVARSAGFTHALLLGMGGAILGPEVLRAAFGTQPGFPQLHVLDSTDPAQVATVQTQLDLKHTLVIVSSKSGSTLQPDVLKQYFFDRMVTAVGAKDAGSHFVAITDPGSTLHHAAETAGFLHVFFGWRDIAGRDALLSDVGLVPAAIMGIDVEKFLERTEEMVGACMPSVPVEDNPGVVLGTVLGVAAHQFGRDKVTIVGSPGVEMLGAWLEQLIAESTGKDGKGLIPIDRERLGTPLSYGYDRLFVHLRMHSAPDTAQDAAMQALELAGQPVVRIALDDAYDLGRECFRWEVATAVAASILGVHPFDRPDVEASRSAARRLIEEYEQNGQLPAERPLFAADGIGLFADERNATTLERLISGRRTLAAYLYAHLSRLRERDYFALLAYLEMNETNVRTLQAIRHRVRDTNQVATCLEFGPRFLHATGQAYKGGPNTGVFLQITCDDEIDRPVPGQRYTLGAVKAAQARGDFQVLAERNRRALRVHLGADLPAALKTLRAAFEDALNR